MKEKELEKEKELSEDELKEVAGGISATRVPTNDYDEEVTGNA